MAIATVGIDLAKTVFAVHGVGNSGQPELIRPEVRRNKLKEVIAALPPCLIGMEACSGAHHWAREFEKMGHTVRIIAAKFVSPYRMSGKSGKNVNGCKHRRKFGGKGIQREFAFVRHDYKSESPWLRG